MKSAMLSANGVNSHTEKHTVTRWRLVSFNSLLVSMVVVVRVKYYYFSCV